MKTSTFPVTDAAWAAVVAQSDTKAIAVFEDRNNVNWPTTAFLVAAPASTDDPIYVLPGAKYVFRRSERPYRVGHVAGYVKTVSGTVDFLQDEDEI